MGGGLAGSEAAWQLAEAGINVRLLEMRPQRPTPVHPGDRLAELVCSNSLRGDSLTNAVGLLKREMEILGSLIIREARASRVPAGGALAVDREGFAEAVTRAVEEHPRITVERHELRALPEGPAILATGPLTSDPLHQALEGLLGEGSLSFFDAVAPIVAADSLNDDLLFRASRYG
ncbi:MAG: FAD-dependent oxidoreductase, partial [Desulfuromonadales bacterium]